MMIYEKKQHDHDFGSGPLPMNAGHFALGSEFYSCRPPWLKGCGTYSLHEWNGQVPSPSTLSGVWMLAHRDGKIFLVHNKDRGWEVPGGHLDPGEAWEACLSRELLEEGSATVRRQSPLAIGRCRIEVPKPEGYKYAYPESHMLFCEVEIDRLLPFRGAMETDNRILVPVEEALRLLRKNDVWNKDAPDSPTIALIRKLSAKLHWT